MAKQSSKITSFFFLLVVLAGLGCLGYLYWPKEFNPKFIPFGLNLNTSLAKGVSFEIEANTKKLSGSEQNLYQSAVLYQRTGEYNKAQKSWLKLLQKHKKNQHLLEQNILAYIKGFPLNSQQILEANETVQRALQLYPDHPTFYYYKGLLQFLLSNENEASNALQKSISLSPQFAKPYLTLATLEHQNKNFKKSLLYSKYAITLGEDIRDKSYALLVQNHIFLSQFDSAQQILTYAQSNYNNNEDLLTSLGLLQESQGLLEQAELQYQKVLGLYPNSKMATKFLSTIGDKEFHQRPANKAKTSSLALNKIALTLVKKYPNDSTVKHLLAYLKIKPPKPKPPVSTAIEDTSTIGNLTQKALEKLKSDENINVSWERLGHYKVRWGSTKNDFFALYPKNNFKELKTNIFFQESPLGRYHQRTTIYFTAKDTLEKIQLLITDSTKKASDLLGYVVKINERVSGVPQSSGVTKCPGFKHFQAYVWNSLDNFEMIAQFQGRPHQIRMVRRSPSSLPKPMNYCHVVRDLLDYSPKKNK
jgi:tetratricopeptide (TPR) repeat protein